MDGARASQRSRQIILTPTEPSGFRDCALTMEDNPVIPNLACR